MSNQRRGFIGLIALLLGVAIIAWLAITMLQRTIGTSGESGQLNQYRSAIDRAKDAKSLIEARSAGN